MKLRTLAIATTFGLIAALTVASTAAADEGGGNGGGRRLSATLTGAAEVPGPGDLDGTGTVALTVRPGHNEVCFDIHVSGIALPATAAHIHQGQVGVAGGIVVTLGTPDAAGNASGCVSASHDLLKAIRQNPSAYYVNVHTTDFPNGALRGQLARRSGQSQGQGQGSRTFQVSLKGKDEVPGPGDPDGSGSATINIDRAFNQVCFTIHVAGLVLPATGAHVHQGARRSRGTDRRFAHTARWHRLVERLRCGDIRSRQRDPREPVGYYVNVHTTDFPNGALRGQLSGSGDQCGGDGDEGGDGGGNGHGNGNGNGGEGNGGGDDVAPRSLGGVASARLATSSRRDGGGCGDDDGDGGTDDD